MKTDLARYLDAAILKPEIDASELDTALRECIALNVWSVCVRPCDIEAAKAACAGTQTAVCVVLGFPHGCQLSASKVEEARRYVALGVDEIDMVANYGWVRSGQWAAVRADIEGVVAVCKPAGVLLKVIFETAQLTTAQVRELTGICVQAGADFVKTSTGFNGEGATVEAVAAMLEVAAGRCRVKPSGGIRSAAQAQAFIDMGAARLGVGWTACRAICVGDGSAGSGY